MKFFNDIIDEVMNVGNGINDLEVDQMVAAIQSANHIFLAGAGRSGLMIRGFANRLLHLGFSVSIVGEISSPHTKAGDLFLIGSGSGETTSLVNQAKIAKENGVSIGLVTTNPKSTLGNLADARIVVPAQSKQSATATLQPMGSSFEQTSLFLYDTMVLYLMEKTGESNDTMKPRHADLE
ncbi:MAG: SIS domain-containing protein [Enterococcus sp.]|uniref:6-phospho-3-hexuloisomerase n=1 Tax=Enterococcus sp. TaxID=35783 RepID=UPI00264870DB|nr:6-phospho-3-hexuloisomerase [Enterococcus sp.]MDN6003693.1 SIS domain-containing protein [Enterococcus sp.]MDN6215415.1 SIS domain-containing protein [Enterococcus sp.]MDN6517198.1 SIS domain-containing protein [Enterococcus sp.]MDN6561157.1 SIS domain-containing protein [Enterococcus sp.]MDN6584676.1 SIS domain-containing protein [Enterococcus sp.]